MKGSLTVAVAALTIGGSAVEAQVAPPRVILADSIVVGGRGAPGGAFSIRIPSAARLGVSVSQSSTPRDTLGVLVQSVVSGSAAEKAGIAEGDRIAAVNGVNLRLSAADAGESDMRGIMARRFEREMAKVRPGDTVRMRVYSNNRFTDYSVVTAAPTVVRAPLARFTSEDADRPTIGAVVGGNPSKRDTLGIFVAEVAEEGPLAKAGVFEGSRIAGVGGVDLRVPAANAGDSRALSERAELLVRELDKVRPGDRVQLRIYDSGSYKTVEVTTARRGDVPMAGTAGGGLFIRRGGADDALMSALPRLDGANEALEQARRSVDTMLQQLPLHVPGRVRVDDNSGGRVLRVSPHGPTEPPPAVKPVPGGLPVSEGGSSAEVAA